MFYSDKLINWYLTRNALPYWCLLFLDFVIVILSTMFVYWLFNRTGTMFDNRFDVFFTALAYGLISLFPARLFKTYSGVIRYSSFIDLMHLANAVILSMVLALIVLSVAEAYGVAALSALDRTQTVITFAVSLLVMGGVRVIVKILYDVISSSSDKKVMRVFIYGALSGGAGLAKYINSLRPRRFLLCGFLSHDRQASHFRLMGKKLYYINDDDIAKVIEEEHIHGVLVNTQMIEEFRNNQRIQDILISAGCKILMAEQLKEADLEGGASEADIDNIRLREVQVEDLLPREAIQTDLKSVEKLLADSQVLITGAAGSIGTEIVRQVAAYKPKALLLIDQAETPSHDLRLMMANDFPMVKAEVVVASISNRSFMENLFQRFKPDYVFHAAAYKHVPMMEDNPSQAVQNNIYGTKVIADLSVKYGVKKFVMVSTDKAVNPTNVMGCSKRICEIYVQSLNKAQQVCKFVTTRFGNVLGSNGSVIPLFRKQIEAGGPVTVTDERIVRFFMLIPEACKLVLEAGTKGAGGEIFVFDMGKPVKIVDLAKRMIALSGAKDVGITFTGLREGEKLYEEVLSELEGTKPSFHEKIRIANAREYDYDSVNHDIEELVEISTHYDDMATVKKMKEIVPEYKSNNSIYEVLDK